MATSRLTAVHRILTSAIAAGAALLVVSCTTMGSQECASADWYRLGYRDGDVYGVQAQIEQYAQQCRTADRRAYMAGWTDGYAEARMRIEKYESP
jgi:hypothetical protein